MKTFKVYRLIKSKWELEEECKAKRRSDVSQRYQCGTGQRNSGVVKIREVKAR